jgi:hypothetical protein
MKKQGEWFNTSLFILSRQNCSGHSGPMIKIVHDGVGVSTSSPPEPCDALSTTIGNQSHTLAMPTLLVQQDSEEREPLL